MLLLEKSFFYRKNIHRILTCLFIHPHIPALSNSIILLVLWVSSLEVGFGIFKTFMIFLLAGMPANILGLLFANELEDVIMGPTGGIFGILGAGLGYIILNWQRIDDANSSKLSLFWMVSIIIMLSMAFSDSAINLAI